MLILKKTILPIIISIILTVAVVPFMGLTTEAADAAYTQQLVNSGFPESYATRLSELHSQHPSWSFTPINTGLSWAQVAAAEEKPGTNLVYYTSLNSWKMVASGTYNFATGAYIGLDGNAWVGASESITEYYLDPRNFMSTDTIFQFSNQRYDSSIQNSTGLTNLVRNTFLAGSCDGTSYVNVLMQAAVQSGVSPYVLAAMIIQEQGSGGTGGCISGSNGYYNFFNIGAYARDGKSAVTVGLEYAQKQGWDTRTKSIIGGACYYGSNYVNKGQNTFYLKKFNVANGAANLAKHQYMTNVQAAASETTKVYSTYNSIGLINSNLNFQIPVFSGMPSSPCEKPTSSGNNNNFLAGLAVNGASFTTAFNTFVCVYDVAQTFNFNTATILATASDGGASVSGIGTVYLSNGTHAYYVTVTAQSGFERSYIININYQSIDKPITSAPNVTLSFSGTAAIFSWPAVENATSYEIMRCTDGVHFEKVIIIPSSQTSFADMYLTPGATYYYKFLAINSNNYTSTGVITCNVPVPKPQLNSPNISVNPNSSSSLNVSWSSVDGANGYALYCSNSENGTFSLLKTFDSSTLSFDDNSFEPFGIRYYKIAAISSDSSKNSEYSAVASCHTKLATPVITKVYNTNVGSTAIDFDTVANATGYEIYRSESGEKNTFSLVGTANSDATSYMCDGIELGKKYYYCVKAVYLLDSRSNSAESNSTSPIGFVYGDVNIDNSINAADVMVMQRYLAGWYKNGFGSIKFNFSAADILQNISATTVTSADTMVLQRYLARWSGYETLPIIK